MAVTNMGWAELESIIADAVLGIYNCLRSEKRRRAFCEDIGTADNQLRENLSREDGAADYTISRMGEAYALKYHLQRVDNIYLALENIHQRRRLSPDMHVLDVGSGTGSGVMAIAYWIARKFNNIPSAALVECIEPAKPMRDTAAILLDAFIKRLSKSHNLEIKTFPFQWQHCVATSLESCIELPEEACYDLILFSHTFHANEPDERKEQIVEVAKRLKPNGMLVFLTPDIQNKKSFIDQAALRLERRINLKSLDIEPPFKGQRVASSKNPRRVVEARHEINIKCQQLDVPNAFGEDPKWDYPYYGWYCTLKVLIKPR